MKNVILFSFLLFVNIFSQSGYNIELKKIYCDWQSNAAFYDSVETIIKDNNGDTIPPSTDFYYEYHVIVDNLMEPPTENTLPSGLGKNKVFEDNDYNFIQTWYVIVKDSINHTFCDTSNTVTFQMEEELNKAKEVICKAYNNGNPISGVNFEHWMYVVDLWNKNYTRYLTIDMNETLKASPNFIPTNNYKFNYWNYGEKKYKNHNTFTFDNDENLELISEYQKSKNATIRAKVDNYYLDVIKFKDPWLRDYNEQPYGIRNRGLDAQFKSLTNSANNLSVSSNHQGVLLNQDYSIPGNPYYSIKIPTSINIGGTSHKINLINWNTTNAQLQYTNQLETGVVFTNNNANVTANLKGSLLSNSVVAYKSGSQRKIVKTQNGTMHSVYESMGKIWYEYSKDNGSTWILGNNNNPLNNGNDAKRAAVRSGSPLQYPKGLQKGYCF